METIFIDEREITTKFVKKANEINKALPDAWIIK